eukprot:1176004-Prorocentrum_minimum.AAC.1
MGPAWRPCYTRRKREGRAWRRTGVGCCAPPARCGPPPSARGAARGTPPAPRGCGSAGGCAAATPPAPPDPPPASRGAAAPPVVRPSVDSMCGGRIQAAVGGFNVRWADSSRSWWIQCAVGGFIADSLFI